jgi:hypothetical protein
MRPDWIRDSGGWLWAGGLILLWVAAVVSCTSRPYRPGPKTWHEGDDTYESLPRRYR